MAYLDRQSFGQRLASLGTAGVIELAIGAALIAGLSVTVVQQEQAPQLSARNIPAPPAPPSETPPSAAPMDSVVTAPKPPITFDTPLAPVPTPFIDVPLPPVPVATADFAPRPPRTTPSPRFSPVSATPRNDPARWVTTNDYPSRDLREGNQGTTGFRVTVDANGRVQSCEVTRSSGFPSLDRAVCSNVTRRARFDPATDEGGKKAVGSYASSVRWQIPG